MDIVVTTPHGDADIDVVAVPDDATLADLLRTVTGQAPAATARVDGRVVPSTRLIADIPLAIGTTIDTRPERSIGTDPTDERGSTAAEASVGLVQLTGRGAGTALTLTPGRFAIGIASQLRGDELAAAPVETTAFELAIADDGSVRARPSEHLDRLVGVDAPTLAGRPFDRELAWIDGQLAVGGRRFELERPPGSPLRRQRAEPVGDGSIPFRRGAVAPNEPRRLVVDAVRDAATGGGRLWQWRPGDRGAYDIGYGLHHDGIGIASVDLLGHGGVAIVGSDRFTSALARTLLVEACTMHGPSTLDVVIASTAETLGRWNWARWLPHLRRGRPTTPARLLTDPLQIGEWADSLPQRTSSSMPQRLTVLVIDDVSLWGRRDSPLRSVVADPPDDLRIVGLCAASDEAPSHCNQLLVEIAPSDRSESTPTELLGSLVAQHSLDPDAAAVVSGISPALVEQRLALEVARHLAPLDDLDREVDADIDVTPGATPPTLSELVDASAEHARDRSRLTVVVGAAEDSPSGPSASSARRELTLDLSGPLSTIITADAPDQHDLTLAAAVLGAATQRRPDELAIVVLGREHRPWFDQLPHTVGWGRSDDTEPTRLLHRLAYVVTHRPELQVMVVVEHAFASDDSVGSDLVAAMNELAVTHDNVHVIWTSDHPGSVPASARSSCGALVWVTPHGDGTVWFPNRSVSFVGVATADESADPDASDVSALVVRPSVIGRSWTPLERRLDRLTADDPLPRARDRSIAAIARTISGRFGGTDSQRSTSITLLPPPLPTEVDATTLLDAYPGDAIPVGLIDRPEHARHEPYWWQPGRDGSLVVVGSSRSAMTSLVDMITLGVAARYSADDLHLYVIEAAGERRRVLESLPHTGCVVEPDRVEDVIQLIDALREELARRLERPTDLDRPDITVLVGDLARMRRSLTPEQIDKTLERLGELVASGAWVGMNILIGASRLDDLGPIERLTTHRLVGPISDPDDRSRLGVAAIDPADRHPRRCWSTRDDRRVQLATSPTDMEARIAVLAPEPPLYRPPMPIVTRGRS